MGRLSCGGREFAGRQYRPGEHQRSKVCYRLNPAIQELRWIGSMRRLSSHPIELRCNWTAGRIAAEGVIQVQPLPG